VNCKVLGRTGPEPVLLPEKSFALLHRNQKLQEAKILPAKLTVAKGVQYEISIHML
jgi:hypothetical protein